MKHIITIQHTQSVHHTNGMVGSWTDWELTELGKKQADKIGKKLSEELGESLKDERLVLYSSDLLRAKQTAESVAKHFGITPIFKVCNKECLDAISVWRALIGFRTLCIYSKQLLHI